MSEQREIRKLAEAVRLLFTAVDRINWHLGVLADRLPLAPVIAAEPEAPLPQPSPAQAREREKAPPVHPLHGWTPNDVPAFVRGDEPRGPEEEAHLPAVEGKKQPSADEPPLRIVMPRPQTAPILQLAPAPRNARVVTAAILDPARRMVAAEALAAETAPADADTILAWGRRNGAAHGSLSAEALHSINLARAGFDLPPFRLVVHPIGRLPADELDRMATAREVPELVGQDGGAKGVRSFSHGLYGAPAAR